MTDIRPAVEADRPAVLAIVAPILRVGETYAMPTDMTDEDVLAYWFAPTHETFVAEAGGEVLGTFYLRANQQGPGSHVANCGYMTAEAARGRGIARAMCAFSIERARERGFRALQFNHVVSTNTGAVKLWQSLGFKIVGTLPEAFRHPQHGFVDSYVMYRKL